MDKKCKSCWWQEGGLCYKEPCKRNNIGRSTKKAIGCNEYYNKRVALSSVIPNENLIIISEYKQ